MKNGLLHSVEVLVSRSFEYGAFSKQLILEAGFRCLENACATEQSVPLLKRVSLIRQWLAFSTVLSEKQKDDLSGVTWLDGSKEYEPGWDPLCGTNVVLTDLSSSSAVAMVFAFMLRKRDHPEDCTNRMERDAFRFSIFFARLLCWRGEQEWSIKLELRQVAKTLVWVNKKNHPNVSNELRCVLSLC